MNHLEELKKRNRRNTIVMLAMVLIVLVTAVACLFVGSSNMSFSDALEALREMIRDRKISNK